MAVAPAKAIDCFARAPEPPRPTSQRICTANEKNRKSMTNKRTVATEFTKNLIINSADGSGSNCQCRDCFVHHPIGNRGVRFLSTPEYCYVKQPKFNIITRYRLVDGLHNLKTRLNKSTSNISSACLSPIDNEFVSVDGLFGERVASSNVAAAHVDKVTALAAQSAGNWSKRSRNVSNENSGHFTITTLSRNASAPKTDKNHILNRNGGVFVSVHDWSTAEHKNDVRMDGEIACNETPVYAVINKANKTRNKQRVCGLESTSSIPNEPNKNANSKRPYFEYNNSIYATIRRSANAERAINSNGSAAAKPSALDGGKATALSDANRKSSCRLQNYAKTDVPLDSSGDAKTYVC